MTPVFNKHVFSKHPLLILWSRLWYLLWERLGHRLREPVQYRLQYNLWDSYNRVSE